MRTRTEPKMELKLEPKKTKEKPFDWYESAPGLPNEKEILLYSLLLVHFRKSVAELTEWVKEIRCQRHAAEGTDLPAEWRPSGSQPR